MSALGSCMLRAVCGARPPACLGQLSRRLWVAAPCWQAGASFSTSSVDVYAKDRLIPQGGMEHVLLDGEALRQVAQGGDHPLARFCRHRQRRVYTTWIAEAQLATAQTPVPADVPVLGRSITEGRLEVLYLTLLDELPRQKHAGKEGRKVDLSAFADAICTLVVASVADVAGFNTSRDVRYVVMKDDFLFQTWLSKAENTGALNRVLKEAGLAPAVPIVWLSEVLEFQASGSVEQGAVAAWTKAQVLDWVKGLTFEDEDDRDEAMEVFRKQKVSGKTLLTYSMDSLVADGMPRGSALVILDALKGWT